MLRLVRASERLADGHNRCGAFEASAMASSKRLRTNMATQGVLGACFEASARLRDCRLLGRRRGVHASCTRPTRRRSDALELGGLLADARGDGAAASGVVARSHFGESALQSPRSRSIRREELARPLETGGARGAGDDFFPFAREGETAVYVSPRRVEASCRMHSHGDPVGRFSASRATCRRSEVRRRSLHICPGSRDDRFQCFERQRDGSDRGAGELDGATVVNPERTSFSLAARRIAASRYSLRFGGALPRRGSAR